MDLILGVPGYLALNLVPPEIKFKFNELLKNQVVKNISTVGTNSSSDLDKMVKDFEYDIADGKKITIVAHSQGNVFANLAYDRLSATNQAYAAIVPVASPESFVRKSFVGHVRFEDAYLANGSSRDFIVNGIINTEAALLAPPTKLQQGAITATLTWTAPTIIDLHVYEPTGAHLSPILPSGNGKAYGWLEIT